MASRWDTVVRCSAGHLYTTTWMPLGSLKAARFGPRRFQRCPVGRHWSMVARVDPRTLSDEERRAAQRAHDVNIV